MSGSDTSAQEEVAKRVRTILAQYDTDGDHKLTGDEIRKVQEDYKRRIAAVKDGSSKPDAVYDALALYDTDSDGTLDTMEMEHMVKDIDSTDTVLRYFAYVAFVARIGKIYRASAAGSMVVSNTLKNPWIIRASWYITGSYVAADLLWEGYCSHLHRHENVGKMLLHLSQRLCFHCIASIALPMYTIRYTMMGTKGLLARSALRPDGFLLRYVPPAMGASMVPIMPYVYDKPVKAALKKSFCAVFGDELSGTKMVKKIP